MLLSLFLLSSWCTVQYCMWSGAVVINWQLRHDVKNDEIIELMHVREILNENLRLFRSILCALCAIERGRTLKLYVRM